jgi:hypothetical protein
MKHLNLPSGKKAKIEYGKGFHLLQAQRKAKNTDEIPYALIAELAEFEGQKIPYEDILQFPLNDVSALLNAINETTDGGMSSQGSTPGTPVNFTTAKQSSSSAPQQTHHSQK